MLPHEFFARFLANNTFATRARCTVPSSWGSGGELAYAAQQLR
jgi:hypothetical protein